MNNYISIKVILDNLLDHPLLEGVSLERAVNYTVNFIRLVGMPNIFKEKTEVITIENYRGILPCDLEKIIQVRLCKNNGNFTTFRYSTDTFHMSENKQESCDLTYKVQGNVIFTSIKEGDIEIAYTAINVDDEGYPLILDDSTFIRALELYIKKQHFTKLFDLGKIQQGVLQNVQQEYAWAVGQTQSRLAMPSIDQMESITNSLNTLIPRVREHKTGFINNGSREKWRNH